MESGRVEREETARQSRDVALLAGELRTRPVLELGRSLTIREAQETVVDLGYEDRRHSWSWWPSRTPRESRSCGVRSNCRAGVASSRTM
jgi:hypothetical protein